MNEAVAYYFSLKKKKSKSSRAHRITYRPAGGNVGENEGIKFLRIILCILIQWIRLFHLLYDIRLTNFET